MNREQLRGRYPPNPLGFIALGPNPQGCAGPGGRSRPDLRYLGQARRSGRFPALPYPPAWHRQHTRWFFNRSKLLLLNLLKR